MESIIYISCVYFQVHSNTLFKKPNLHSNYSLHCEVLMELLSEILMNVALLQWKQMGPVLIISVRVGCCDGLKGRTISKLFDTPSRGEGGGRSIQRKYTQVARRSTSGSVHSVVETYWVGAKFCKYRIGHGMGAVSVGAKSSLFCTLIQGGENTWIYLFMRSLSQEFLLNVRSC